MKITPDIISSRQNQLVKMAASLADKKGREAARAFAVDGFKLCREAALARLPVTHVFLSAEHEEDYLDDILDLFSADIYKDTVLTVLTEEAFEKISTEKSPQGVTCVIKYLDFFKKKDIIYKVDFFLSPEERTLFLWSVGDPGNLGAVIRSAAAFGIRHIVLGGDCADIYNPRTLRGAMGAAFRVKVTAVSDSLSFVRAARANGRRVFAAELRDGALPLPCVSVGAGDIFIIGNEGHGIPPELSAACDASVYIPISQNTESLNASVAAAIFIWEMSKH